MTKEISIQELLGEVRNLAEDKTHTELLELVQGLARRVPVEGRNAFLADLRWLTGGGDSSVKSGEENVDSDEQLLRNIEFVKEEAEERLEKIENGEWDDLYDYGSSDPYYDDEGPDVLTSDHEDQLKEVLMAADHCYLDAEYQRAAKFYHALIEFEGLAWDDLNYPLNICGQEIAEKYCRCVLSLAGAHEKGVVLFGALKTVAANLQFRAGVYRESGMLSLDGIGLSPGGLAQLRTVIEQNSSQLSKRIYIELLVMAGAWEEAQVWIQKYGEKYHTAFLYFLHALHYSEQWSRLSECTRLGLDFFDGHDRLHIAGLLKYAGAMLKSETDMADGLRIHFFYSPSVEQVVELVGLIQSPANLSAELSEYERFLSTSAFGQCHALVLILQGHFNEVFRRCADNPQPLGWSHSSPDAIAFCVGLLQLTPRSDDLPRQLKNLINRHIFPNSIFSLSATTEGSEKEIWNQRFIEQLRKELFRNPLNEDGAIHLLAELREMVSRRAERIVESKFRKAYGRAAEGLVAWSKVAGIHGLLGEADGLIQEFLDKFPRHSAFKKELRQRC